MEDGHRAPLLVSPVASGKTVMFAYLASSAAAKGKRVLILAHRIELIEQISETLDSFNTPHGLIIPAVKFFDSFPVQVGSVFTVAKRLDLMQTPDLIIVDEAHHYTNKTTFGRVLRYFPSAKVIGVTASPWRLSGEALGDIFDDLIIGPTVRELINIGALSDYKIYAPHVPDLTGLHMQAGDFSKHELSFVINKPSITGNAISHYQKLAAGKRAIVFCVSVEHAVSVASEFRAAGINAASVDGGMDQRMRKIVIDNFRKGRVQVLTSCDLISEGFSLNDIQCGIMLRPTASLGLWIQQTGRCLRAMPGKTHAILLDHAGNALRHGLPCDERQWSLAGRIKPKRDAGVGSVRLCPVCFFACKPSAVQCTECGAAFPIKPRAIEEVDGDLEELDRLAVRKQQTLERKQAATLPELIALGKARGYSNPYYWAQSVLRGRNRA